jgi:hypothetical protein
MPMGRINLAELPAALAEHVPPRARLTYPTQGMTSEVAFVEHDGRAVVVKRCANPLSRLAGSPLLRAASAASASVAVVDAFYTGYGSAALDDATRRWFVRLYDYF